MQGYYINLTPSQKQNLQKIIPQHIKDFYPHEIDFITFFEPVNKPYIYEHVMGFLYITKEPCGIYSFKGIDCSNADYSISFYVTHDDERRECDSCNGFLTMHISGRQYILPAEYNKIEAIYPNIKKQLQNKSFLILPIKIQMRTFIGINTYPSPIHIITISTTLKTNSQENKEILKQYEYDCTRLPYTPEYCPRKLDDRIYTYSKDLYVNVREKPDIKSNIILRIATTLS